MPNFKKVLRLEGKPDSGKAFTEWCKQREEKENIAKGRGNEILLIPSFFLGYQLSYIRVSIAMAHIFTVVDKPYGSQENTLNNKE